MKHLRDMFDTSLGSIQSSLGGKPKLDMTAFYKFRHCFLAIYDNNQQKHT